MPGKVQNPDSWFYKARLRAGFRNAASLAERLGVPKGTVYQWERGSADPGPSYRPPWRIMPQLAAILNATLPELVEALWRETIGDPCPCGCGGRKALPDSTTAHKLVVKLPCAECGKERFYPQGKRDRHRKFCGEHHVQRIAFTCIGYQDHDATRHALKCRGTIYLRPSDVNARLRLKERFPNSRFSLDTPSYQCNRCGSTERLIAAQGEMLREIETKETGSKKSQVKTRKREDRLELFQKHRHRLKLRRGFTREEQERGRQRHADNAAMGRRYPKKTKANLIRRWSGLNLPKEVRFGQCIVCDKLVMTFSDVAKFHRRCHQEWEGTEKGRHFQSLKVRGEKVSLPAGKSGPGRRVTEESLKRSYSWAVEYYLGEKSLRDIAKENGVHFTSVRERIDFIIEKLPDPELSGSRFRRAIQLLLNAASEAPSQPISA